MPAAQGLQDASEAFVRPTGPKLPGAQAGPPPAQEAAPVTSLKVLLGHGRHCAMAAKKAPAALKVPGGHGLPKAHDVWPCRIEYVPGVQGVHVAAASVVLPFGPYVPLTHPMTTPVTGNTAEKVDVHVPAPASAE